MSPLGRTLSGRLGTSATHQPLTTYTKCQVAASEEAATAVIYCVTIAKTGAVNTTGLPFSPVFGVVRCEPHGQQVIE